MPAVKALIFDKDGTLADARPFLRDLAIARARACTDVVSLELPETAPGFYHSLCQAFGVTPTGLDPDGLMAVGTRAENEQAVIERLTVLGWSLERARRLIPRLFRQVEGVIIPKAAHTPPFPGTETMLHQLRHHAVKVGILSSDSTPNVEGFLRYYGFDTLVHGWRGTDHGDLAKPDPGLFWELCDRLQIRPDHTLMVGDSWADREVALNAGAAAFVSVAESWGRTPVSGADYAIQDWGQLLNLLEQG